MEPLIAWAFCGLVTGVITSNKGHPGTGWFLLGMLLGPFGIILALMMPADRRQLDAQALASGEMRQCSMCAELVRREAVRCRYCGADLAPLGPGTPDAPARSTGSGRRFRCERCNHSKPAEQAVMHEGLWLCRRCQRVTELQRLWRTTITGLRIGLLILVPLLVLVAVVDWGRRPTLAPSLSGISVTDDAVPGKWLDPLHGQTFRFYSFGRVEMGHLHADSAEITHDWKVTPDHRLCVYDQAEDATPRCWPYRVGSDGQEVWLSWGELPRWRRVGD